MRAIKLPKGGVLEFEFTPQLEKQIREKYSLQASDPIDDDLIREFLYYTVRNAVDRYERGI